MRYLVLADIHGNLPALESVLEVAAPLYPDAILVAGDHANAGPFPRQTLELLRASGCLMIRGNGDDYLLDYARGRWPAEMRVCDQWAPVRWAVEQISADDIDLLEGLPEQRVLDSNGHPPVRLLHGSLARSNEGILPVNNPAAQELFRQAHLVLDEFELPQPADALAQIRESVLICAHTHIPWMEAVDARVVFNPGSVGAPVTGDPRAQYALLEWTREGWQVDLCAVPYDIPRVRQEYIDSGMLEAAPGMARACLANIETGLNVAWFFILHVLAVARARSADVSTFVPDPIWEEACLTFNWQEYEVFLILGGPAPPT
jgi:predicted phosphodiesterase